MEKEKREARFVPVLGISIGDMNGIGLEVIMKTFADTRILRQCTPVIYGSSKIIGQYKKSLKNTKFNYNIIEKAENAQSRKINLVQCVGDDVEVSLGKVTNEGGNVAFASLKVATQDLCTGKVHALVTAPINKKNIQNDEFQFPGHTEYLTEQSGERDSLMLLICDELRIGVITGHIPVGRIAQSITPTKIKNKVNILNQSLKNDFGIERPKIAVLGLNPHAGDNGLLGQEEEEIIKPAIQELKENGTLVFGPYSADGFFGSFEFKKFDAVLAMYHDQGLIPFKTIAFEKGVNFTAGLPVIRTSPDHGTAYDIAGKDIASPESFREAVYKACDIAQQKNRK
ncbi:MAG: 4-hydroxythreonine-4-phosphate dehydrogenase PdxA [Cytophagales bacterium]|nr:4-hydroxythreonine-4-phosphate dehydrogenase PdxA [Cytophagales bacterium]